MKEVNFRAWHKINERMHDVLSLQFTMKGQIFSMLLDNGKTPDVSNIELMQYTGLKDCKGKEIYESDIVSYEYENVTGWHKQKRVVRWNDKAAAFEIPPYSMWSRNIKVIGNIYENPELLEATA